MTESPRSLVEMSSEPPGGVDCEMFVSPSSPDDVATVLRHATAAGKVVQVVGGGTHSGFGAPAPPDIVMSTTGLDVVEAWEPDDLTMVVGAGARVADVERRLGAENQTAVLPERPGAATVGGTIAAGVSALRRGRLFGTRERLLETTIVTGDGRIVRSGGRVVKNVTGYDLHRLQVGAFGSLGVIVSVCLKLWPTPPAAATVTVTDLSQASVETRPLAVLEDGEAVRVFVWGTEREVDAAVSRLGGEVVAGLNWPTDPSGVFEWSLRVPPALTVAAVEKLAGGWRYLALHGVGEVRMASDEADSAPELRHWAESVGGHLISTRSPDGFDVLDPWGEPPPALGLQRRLIHEFDPARVINPGRLPGGI